MVLKLSSSETWICLVWKWAEIKISCHEKKTYTAVHFTSWPDESKLVKIQFGIIELISKHEKKLSKNI